MKDATGVTVAVGDSVAYTRHGSTRPVVGEITRFTPKRIMIAETTPTGPAQWEEPKAPEQVILIANNRRNTP
jgi:hypothetical protein